MTDSPHSASEPDRNLLQMILELGQTINSTLDLRKVFWRTADQLHGLLGCPSAQLVLVEDDRACRGFLIDFAEQPPWRNLAADQINTQAIEKVINDREFRSGEGMAHFPLISRDKVIGVLSLGQTHGPQRMRAVMTHVCPIMAVALDNASAYDQIAQMKRQLERENLFLRREVDASMPIVGSSAALAQVKQAIDQVAGTDSTVLITGETGTGKELVCRAIHEKSRRHAKLLIKVNCAALSPGLITSELFGHEAGAFTGATRRRQGRFELAQGGTIFLDEVTEIPPDGQVLLLRVLQERVIERVGGSQSIPVDVRVVAASNRDMPQAIRDGSFREDLFYRLNVFPIQAPPLRDRIEDLPELIDHLLARLNRTMNKQVHQVGKRTLEALAQYPWPGNIRELENLLERAVIVSPGDELLIDPTWLACPASAGLPTGSLKDIEHQAIVDALERCGGKVYGKNGAAAALGLKPTTLYGKMRKYGVRK